VKRAIGLAVLITVLAVLATPSQAAPTAQPTTTITLVAHDSFAVSKSVLAAFTKDTGIKVKILQSGDAGAALNQAILASQSGAPLGDAFFGVDNTFLSRALDAKIFAPYSSPALSSVPPQYQLDATHRLTPIDHGDVCITYDKQWFAKRKLAVPTTLGDLTKPSYKGKLVVENPATSSPGLAFLLATVARYGRSGWRGYWDKLRANDVKVDDDWNKAYDGDFTQGGNQGTYPLVVSYATDPAAGVYFSKPQPKVSPIGTMLSSCFRQVEFAGVLKGSEHVAAARKLVDFMLSQRFQRDMPLQMFVFPVRNGTPLPAVFQKYAQVAPDPLTLPAKEVGGNRDQWIEQWTNTVLR